MTILDFLSEVIVQPKKHYKCNKCKWEGLPIVEFNRSNKGFKGSCGQCGAYIQFIKYEDLEID